MSISGHGHAYRKGPVEACSQDGISYKDASGPSVQGLDQVAKVIRSSTINVLFAVHDERVGRRLRISQAMAGRADPRKDVQFARQECLARV